MRIIFLVFIFLFSATNHSYAMECVPKEFEEIFNKADVIFKGKVIKRDSFNMDEDELICWKHSKESPKCGEKIAMFEVTKTWKGDVGDNPSVYASDACYCLGSYFITGEEYIVFANVNNKKYPYHADYQMGTVCDGTVGISKNNPEDELIRKLDEEVSK